MEVGENRVRVFNGTVKREGERLEIYTGGIGSCSSTVYQTCDMSPVQVQLYHRLLWRNHPGPSPGLETYSIRFQRTFQQIIASS